MDRKLKITVQHFHGCPNGPKMIANVKNAIKQFGDNIEYSEQIINSPELAIKYNFRGSPTLLINGKDFEGMNIPKEINISCRFYSNGIPLVEEIIEKIEKEIKLKTINDIIK